MRKVNLSQLVKTATAFGAVSALTIDLSLLLTHRLGLATVPGHWYLDAPLIAWTLGGLPASIVLSERLLTQARGYRHSKIIVSADDSSHLRQIPVVSGSQTGTVFASSARSIFPTGDSHQDFLPAVWQVPVDDQLVSVRESELLQFLRLADRRPKYKFSRRYWCERRRPAIPRQHYAAYMELLTSAGLIAGRHPQGGASGWLIYPPRACIVLLKAWQ